MSFSSYGFIKQVNDLHRKKVYKEKLRKLYKVEYGKHESEKELRVIPQEKVEESLRVLREERSGKKRESLIKNILILLMSLLVLRSIVYLISYSISTYYA